jgi:SAM-dependent methyltransferase
LHSRWPEERSLFRSDTDANRLAEKGLRPNAPGRYDGTERRPRPTIFRATFDCIMLKLTRPGGLLFAFLAVLAGLDRAAAQPQSLAPYIATPDDVVERMLALGEVTEKDVVYDLGCGDGRIPIAAAKRYGARGVGVDIDPRLVAQAQQNAKAQGVEALVEFKVEDAMATDVSSATVVTLFLLSSSNEKLKPMLTRQVKPGARIVSHAFSMGREWPADRIDQFVSARGDDVTLYLWRIR